MSNRLNQDREERLQPKRMEVAIQRITALGFSIEYKDKTCIAFYHNGHRVIYYPYSGWATGKTIKDGRGLQNLLKQLK